MERVDSEPGHNRSTLMALQQKVQDNKEAYTDVCIMIDAMAIKKHTCDI